MKLSEKLRQMRKERKLTQAGVEAVCGVNRVNVSKYEIGTSVPALKTLSRLAEAYGVTVSEILSGTEEKVS